MGAALFFVQMPPFRAVPKSDFRLESPAGLKDISRWRQPPVIDKRWVAPRRGRRIQRDPRVSAAPAGAEYFRKPFSGGSRAPANLCEPSGLRSGNYILKSL